MANYLLAMWYLLCKRHHSAMLYFLESGVSEDVFKDVCKSIYNQGSKICKPLTMIDDRKSWHSQRHSFGWRKTLTFLYTRSWLRCDWNGMWIKITDSKSHVMNCELPNKRVSLFFGLRSMLKHVKTVGTPNITIWWRGAWALLISIRYKSRCW